MREIKFRAWNGGMMRFLDQGDFIIEERGMLAPDEMGDKWKERDWTLMQFAGLKDKNGKEIYEGDIVTKLNLNIFHSNGKLNRDRCLEYIEWGVVAFMFPTCQFMLVRGKESIWKWADSYNNTIKLEFSRESLELEVVGNIHENPELINKPLANSGRQ